MVDEGVPTFTSATVRHINTQGDINKREDLDGIGKCVSERDAERSSSVSEHKPCVSRAAWNIRGSLLPR